MQGAGARYLELPMDCGGSHGARETVSTDLGELDPGTWGSGNGPGTGTGEGELAP